jgi:hypothetical protein
LPTPFRPHSDLLKGECSSDFAIKPDGHFATAFRTLVGNSIQRAQRLRGFACQSDALLFDIKALQFEAT